MKDFPNPEDEQLKKPVQEGLPLLDSDGLWRMDCNEGKLRKRTSYKAVAVIQIQINWGMTMEMSERNLIQ